MRTDKDFSMGAPARGKNGHPQGAKPVLKNSRQLAGSSWQRAEDQGLEDSWQQAGGAGSHRDKRRRRERQKLE